MAVKVVIIVSITLVAGIGLWAVMNSVVQTLTAPSVTLMDPQFTTGSCQDDYFLFWVVGHHEMVTATFGLKNDGPTGAHAQVVFTAEGARTDEGDFFIGAGKTATQAFQFRVNDCGQHTF